MIRVFGVTTEYKSINDISLEDMKNYDTLWFWVDFISPTQDEVAYLDKYFHFHQLSVEDAVMSLNRPKLDYYDDYNFFILNALDQTTLNPVEVSLFVGNNFIVSYHSEPLKEMDEAWESVKQNTENWDKGAAYVVHNILDKIVDQFFTPIYNIEDYLDNLESNSEEKPLHELIDDVFEIRGDLIKLRRVIYSMRDLLYRILNSERLQDFKDYKLFFADIYDHLLKLSEMVESIREITSDMRDSYLSVSTNRMNTNMMILTIITTIFIPLTFIVGVYGMNFKYMPELEWKYGYFFILLIMLSIGISMFIWFKRKGWLNT